MKQMRLQLLMMGLVAFFLAQTAAVEARQALWNALQEDEQAKNAAANAGITEQGHITTEMINNVVSQVRTAPVGPKEVTLAEGVKFIVQVAKNDVGRTTINGQVAEDLAKVKKRLVDGIVLNYGTHQELFDKPIKRAVEEGRSKALGETDDVVKQAMDYHIQIGDIEGAAWLRKVVGNGRLLSLTPAQGEEFLFDGHASKYLGGSIYLDGVEGENVGTLVHELKALQGYTDDDAQAFEDAYNNASIRNEVVSRVLATDVQSPAYLAKNLDDVITDDNVGPFIVDGDQLVKADSQALNLLKGRAQVARQAGKPIIVVATEVSKVREALVALEFPFDIVLTEDELPAEAVARKLDLGKAFLIASEWKVNTLKEKLGFGFAAEVEMPDDQPWDLRTLALRAIRDLADEK